MDKFLTWFVEFFRVPYSTVRRGDVILLRRYKLVSLFWVKIRLHRMFNPDVEREDTHDHPWWFLSLILTGEYLEVSPEHRRFGPRCGNGYKFYGAGMVNFCRATWRHRLACVKPNTWTLFIHGRGTRNWGFYHKGAWIPHDIYDRVVGSEERNDANAV